MNGYFGWPEKIKPKERAQSGDTPSGTRRSIGTSSYLNPVSGLMRSALDTRPVSGAQITAIKGVPVYGQLSRHSLFRGDSRKYRKGKELGNRLPSVP